MHSFTSTLAWEEIPTYFLFISTPIFQLSGFSFQGTLPDKHVTVLHWDFVLWHFCPSLSCSSKSSNLMTMPHLSAGLPGASRWF